MPPHKREDCRQKLYDGAEAPPALLANTHQHTPYSLFVYTGFLFLQTTLADEFLADLEELDESGDEYADVTPP